MLFTYFKHCSGNICHISAFSSHKVLQQEYCHTPLRYRIYSMEGPTNFLWSHRSEVAKPIFTAGDFYELQQSTHVQVHVSKYKTYARIF